MEKEKRQNQKLQFPLLAFETRSEYVIDSPTQSLNSCPSASLQPLSPSKMLLSITLLAWRRQDTSLSLSCTTDKHDRTWEPGMDSHCQAHEMPFTCCRCYEFWSALSKGRGWREGGKKKKRNRFCVFHHMWNKSTNHLINLWSENKLAL